MTITPDDPLCQALVDMLMQPSGVDELVQRMKDIAEADAIEALHRS